MAEYQVDALGGRFEVTVDASSEEEARERAREQLNEEFDHTVGVTGYSVYDVMMKYGGVIISVKARSRHEAEDAVRSFTERKKSELLDDVSVADRAFIQDLRTDVEVERTRDDGHYQLNEAGEIEEGEL